MANIELIQAIAATAELCGTNLTQAAAELLLADLSSYDANAVVSALSRCRRELKGRLTLAEIIARIDDGRPGPEEAWAMLPRDEGMSVVWTEEMIEAWGIARSMMAEDEMVPARMAFKESYVRLVSDARDQRRPVKWTASLGHDKEGRTQVIQRAVEMGRLTQEHALTLLPAPADGGPVVQFLLTGNSAPLLQVQKPADRAVAREHIEKMRRIVGGGAILSDASEVAQ